jgi:alkylation response protein AidB-like acyl-CoA dehydrogenase
MDFELNEEQKMIQEMTRDFCEKEVKPLAEEIDKEHRYPKELVARMAELGLMGICVPEEYGGAGMDTVSYAIALEEISLGCASTGVIMSVNNSLVCDPILDFGNEEQKKKFLTPLASGEKLGCLALTEPGAGSDAAAIKTTAVLDDGEYVINGTKLFITNGREADTIVLMAVTDKEKGHRGISAFIIEADTPGYSVGKIEDKLGIHGTSTAELIFENARIPKENLLGKEGEGFKIALSTLDGGRVGIAAQALGIARASLEAAISYSKERVQFGKPIATLQAIQWMIADMACELDAARLLTYRAACLKDKKRTDPKLRYSLQGAMCKLKAAEVASFCANKALQIHGGYGYTSDYPLERHLRDAKITEIYEGTSEIQRLVIASTLLKD